MKLACDDEKGLMAVLLDDAEDVVRYARCRYDGRLGAWTPDSIISMKDYFSTPTKKLAIEKAEMLRFPAAHVERIGNRFGVGWGIRLDFRSAYFLATYD